MSPPTSWKYLNEYAMPAAPGCWRSASQSRVCSLPSLVPSTDSVTWPLLTAPRLRFWRSEERRVGKECVSTCRSRLSPPHYKNKHEHHKHVLYIDYRNQPQP